MGSSSFKRILKENQSKKKAGVCMQHPAFAVLKTRRSRWGRNTISPPSGAHPAAARPPQGMLLCPAESLPETLLTDLLSAAALSPYCSALPCSKTFIPCSNIPQTKRNICQNIAAALPTSIHEPFWYKCTHLEPFLFYLFFFFSPTRYKILNSCILWGLSSIGSAGFILLHCSRSTVMFLNPL